MPSSCALSANAITTPDSLRVYWPQAPAATVVNGMTVICSTGGGRTLANVTVDAAGGFMVLTTNLTTDNILFNTQTTLGAVVSHINNILIGNGWAATLLVESTWPSTTLVNVPSPQNAFGVLVTLQHTQDCPVIDMINAASDAVEVYCNRFFKARDLLEIVRVRSVADDSFSIRVKGYPVQRVYRLMGGRQEAVRITNSNATATSAWARYDRATTTLALTIYGGTNDNRAAPTQILAVSSLQALVDLINITGFGWAATVASSLANVKGADLLDSPAENAKAATASLYIPGDPFSYQLDAANGTIRPGNASRFVHQHLEVVDRWPEFIVDYRGGYETIPPSLQLLLNKIIKDGFDLKSRDFTLQSETLGDYSYSLGSGAQGMNAAFIGAKWAPELSAWQDMEF